MHFTAEQKRQRIWLEIKDILTGAAFPVMIQLIFSASVILFADYTEDIALAISALVFGELLVFGAYLIFGRQNGIVGYRRKVQTEKKRELATEDVRAYYKTGEYTPWKGIVIGAVTVVPFVIIQFIQCVAPNLVCEFLVKYAFGWAAYPFILIGQAMGELSPWLNFVWIVIPIAIHAAAYIWGGKVEEKRQQKAAEAQSFKDKRRK